MSGNYKGDVSATDCWAALAQDRSALLIDVRTRPEWTFVGMPRLESVGKSVIQAEWQVYPTMSIDPNFASLVAEAVVRAGGDKSTQLFFLCRSGQRSMSAAAALTAEGYDACFNVVGGFEGPQNEEDHRGTLRGWKAEGLPWAQG